MCMTIRQIMVLRKNVIGDAEIPKGCVVLLSGGFPRESLLKEGGGV